MGMAFSMGCASCRNKGRIFHVLTPESPAWTKPGWPAFAGSCFILMMCLPVEGWTLACRLAMGQGTCRRSPLKPGRTAPGGCLRGPGLLSGLGF